MTQKKRKFIFMSRPGITYFDVSKAAQELIGQGKSPTVELVRALLRTGSNSTISTHLRSFREKQDPANQLLIQTRLPDELISLMKGLWERVITQAGTQVETIKQEVQQEITQLKKTAQDLQQENNRHQQQYSQTKQERDGFFQEKSALENILSDIKIEKAALQTRQDGLTQQLKEKQSRIDELHRQNQQTQANLEHYRTTSAEQRQQDQQRCEQQQNLLDQTLKTLKNEAAELLSQKITLQQSNEQLHFEKISLQAQLDKMTDYYEIASSRLSEASKSLSQEKNTRQHWQAQFENINIKWEEQTQLNIDLKIHMAALSQEIKSIKSELIEISSQNKALAHEKWILGQEKAQLYGQFKQLESSVTANSL
jgi:chromosome segregation ATPase